MVCMLGHWRMTAHVKLLLAENSSDITAEEINDEKIEIIQKRYLDADETNLLDEEDMHVFGFRPMTDPLHLVRCNACKKPIKASQYSFHAERCGTLNSGTDSSTGIDNDLPPTKPPRKGRKISEIIANNNQITRPNLVVEENQNISSVESQSSTVTMNHATVTKTPLTISKDIIPVPLATKIYHCHGHSRLRFELGQIYHDNSEKVHFGNFSNLDTIQENVISCDDLPSGPEKNGFAQTKKGPQVAKTLKGMPNGRYPSTIPPYSG